MPDADHSKAGQQSSGFLYLYALAAAGGAVAYIPFLTILLPNQATALFGEGALTLLAYTTFAGAVAASIANVAAGWISDCSRTRRAWIVVGMILSSALLVAMPLATQPALVVTLIICWQCALNLMLAPLSAWAGDCVPDSQKGLLGGLLAFAPALGALAGALVTLPGLTGQGGRLWAVALLVIVMITPVLIFGRPCAMPHLMQDRAPGVSEGVQPPFVSRSVLRMWLARLFVQIAEAALFAFLLLWFRSIAPDFRDVDSAAIFAAVLAVSVVIALIIGRWSDRAKLPILPLGLCAVSAAAGLVIMATTEGLTAAITGYFIFGVSTSVFLALHSSQTLRVITAPRTRARNLGLFNLTNTIPSMIMPWLILATVPSYGFGVLFASLSALALLAGIMMFTMPRQMD